MHTAIVYSSCENFTCCNFTPASMKRLEWLISPIGRVYLSQCSSLLKLLVECLQSEEKDSVTEEKVLGALQKLSLRSCITPTLACSDAQPYTYIDIFCRNLASGLVWCPHSLVLMLSLHLHWHFLIQFDIPSIAAINTPRFLWSIWQNSLGWWKMENFTSDWYKMQTLETPSVNVKQTYTTFLKTLIC